MRSGQGKRSSRHEAPLASNSAGTKRPDRVFILATLISPQQDQINAKTAHTPHADSQPAQRLRQHLALGVQRPTCVRQRLILFRPWHPQEVTLSGDTGQAKLAGDQLKLREGKLYINEQFVADTPPGAVIRYVAAGSIKSLYINGKSAATKP